MPRITSLPRLTPIDVLGRKTARVPVEPESEETLPRSGGALIVNSALYHQGRRIRDVKEVGELRDALHTARDTGGFVWIGLCEPTAQEFSDIAAQFDLPALPVEDAIKAHQRPKLERYGDMAFAVVKPAWYVDSEEVVEIGEIALFVAKHFVVTVRHGDSRVPAKARRLLEAQPTRLARGPGAVLHQMMDLVVDGYLAVIDAVEVDIDQIEVEVFSGDSSDHSERIYKLKREVLEFRRAVGPLVSPLQRLSESEEFGLDEVDRLLFRDVYDHALRGSEAADAYDALLTGVLQADLAQVSVRQNRVAAQQNEDMRRITAWAAIGLVPTAIAGVYGMNFDNMPELHWQYGYFMVIGVIVTTCTGLYVMFRRNHWL